MALKTSQLVAPIGVALAVFGVIAGMTFLSDRQTSTTPTVRQVLSSGELEQQQQAAAVGNVRALVPALEAYYRDHGSYVGATLQTLRDHYDHSLVGADVVRVSADGYCIESVVGTGSAFKAGPTARILPGTCPRG